MRSLALMLVLCGCQPAPFIDWANLKNPILSAPDRCIKNQSVVLHDDRFFVFAFQRFEDGGTANVWATRDFQSYETLAPEPLAALSTSDLLQHEGKWHLVTQGASPSSTATHRLLHGTSADLRSWSPLAELAPGNESAQRQIDGTLVFADGHFWLGYKGDQDFFVMRSQGAELDGRWEAPREASAAGEWAEAFHFYEIDGQWRLVATARDPKGWRCINPYVCSHEPFIYTRDGDDWTRWTEKRQLHVPLEDWNSSLHANGASLNDWRAQDGWFYLFYAGSDDLDSFGGRSHCKLGVARSKDLITWRLPGDLRD